jgi:hypothetical protein
MKWWFLSLFLLLAMPCFSAEVVFSPSVSPGVTNYTIYYGTNKASIGVSTNWVVTNVGPASVVSIYATAWANGQESLASNTALYTNKNFAPLNLRIINPDQPLALESSTDLQNWRTLAIIDSGDQPLLIHPDMFSFFRTQYRPAPLVP